MVFKHGRVVGVEADEMYYADMVIYTGFAKDLPSVIDDLPKAYIDDLNGIVRTKSLTSGGVLTRDSASSTTAVRRCGSRIIHTGRCRSAITTHHLHRG